MWAEQINIVQIKKRLKYGNIPQAKPYFMLTLHVDVRNKYYLE